MVEYEEQEVEEHEVEPIDEQVEVVEAQEEFEEEAVPEVDVAELQRELQALKTSMGRVKKSLFQEQPQQQIQPQQQYVQPQQQYTQPSASLNSTLVEAFGEEAARPVQTALDQEVERRVKAAIAPYEGVLSQVSQAVSASEVSRQNMNHINAAFGDVDVREVARLMRDDGIDEDQVRMFEQNPGIFPFESTAVYFRQASTKQKPGAAQVINRAASKSKPILAKKQTKPLSIQDQLKGKSTVEISKMARNNPEFRKKAMKELGLNT